MKADEHALLHGRCALRSVGTLARAIRRRLHVIAAARQGHQPQQRVGNEGDACGDKLVANFAAGLSNGRPEERDAGEVR